ncbi:MAG: hypothetical protein MAG451_02126 [Anaerolineales bacterium]|nr:hypothetical protein [Anaerolineales bacterium]
MRGMCQTRLGEVSRPMPLRLGQETFDEHKQTQKNTKELHRNHSASHRARLVEVSRQESYIDNVERPVAIDVVL